MGFWVVVVDFFSQGLLDVEGHQDGREGFEVGITGSNGGVEVLDLISTESLQEPKKEIVWKVILFICFSNVNLVLGNEKL